MIEGMEKTWADARTHCQGLATGYDLVVINDEDEQKFLEKEISARIDYWIGLQEVDNKEYIWIDRSTLVYGSTLKQYPWDSGAPDNVSNSCPLITIIILTKTPQ